MSMSGKPAKLAILALAAFLAAVTCFSAYVQTRRARRSRPAAPEARHIETAARRAALDQRIRSRAYRQYPSAAWVSGLRGRDANLWR